MKIDFAKGQSIPNKINEEIKQTIKLINSLKKSQTGRSDDWNFHVIDKMTLHLHSAVRK